jgi:hypothetical protein
MQTERARLLAERLHANDHEEDGTPLLEQVRRVARRADVEAQAMAWLHEVLEWTTLWLLDRRRGTDNDASQHPEVMPGRARTTA